MPSLKIDCDSHFLPFDAFDDVDPKFADRAPRFVFDAQGRSVVVYKPRWDQIPPFMWNYPTCFVAGQRHPGTADADVRAHDLAKIGFDMQVLVPNNAPYAYDVDPELGVSVCRSYNNAVSRVLKKHPDKFIGLAVVPMQSVQLAIHLGQFWFSFRPRRAPSPTSSTALGRTVYSCPATILTPSRGRG